MIDLEFVVWEFVRLMVELEQSANEPARGHGGGALAAWREPWRELDVRLVELGRRDANGFADLMMDQVVTVPCRSQRQLSDAVDALTRVTTKLQTEIKKNRKDTKRVVELEFERTELEGVIERLRAIDPTVLG